MTVYLDIVFLENVLMNYIIIFATGIVIRADIKRWKIFIASIIGAIYTIVMYINIIPIYSNFLMKLILSIALVYIAYKPKTPRRLIKDLCIFYFVSFVFGGCVFALMYLLQPQMVQIRNGVFIGAYPMKVAIIGGIISFCFVQLSFKIVKTRLNKKDMLHAVQITINNKTVNVTALLDTGNLLKDPITGFPVIVVEHRVLDKIVPEQILKNLNKIIGGEIDELTNNVEFSNTISRFRMIPFSSLGKQNGLLLGIKADNVNIELNEKTECINNVIVGIYDKSFTKNGTYSAIFGLDILEGGKTDEHITNVKI